MMSSNAYRFCCVTLQLGPVIIHTPSASTVKPTPAPTAVSINEIPLPNHPLTHPTATHTLIHIYIHTHKQTHAHTQTQQTQTQTTVSSAPCSYNCTHIQIAKRARAHTHIDTHTGTHTHTHTHTHKHKRKDAPSTSTQQTGNYRDSLGEFSNMFLRGLNDSWITCHNRKKRRAKEPNTANDSA